MTEETEDKGEIRPDQYEYLVFRKNREPYFLVTYHQENMGYEVGAYAYNIQHKLWNVRIAPYAERNKYTTWKQLDDHSEIPNELRAYVLLMGI